MSPKKKQIIYGIFYFLVLIFIVFLVTKPSLKKVPSCFDKIQNGNEEGIDCGGSCTPCYIKEAKPLNVLGEPLIFKNIASGRLFALINIQNPNENVGSHIFYYSVDFYDKDNNLVGKVNSTDNIFPVESKYIVVKYSGTAYDIGRIEQLKVSFDNIVWARSIEFLKPTLSFIKEPNVSIKDEFIIIEGKIANQSIFNVPQISIIGVLKDKYGNPLFIGDTVSNSIPAGESYDFSIFIPSSFVNPDYLKGMKSEVFLSVKE